MGNDHYDVIVVGGGFGGMCAAARLADKGYKTLLVERLAFLGGRTSSIDNDGYQISTGAIAIPGGGIIEETYKDVGAEFNVRTFKPEMVFRIEGKDYDEWSVGKGLFNSMYEYAADKEGALKVIDAIGRAVTWQFPFGTTSLKDWLSQHTDDERIYYAFQPFCIALLGTNIHELPVSEFFAWMAQGKENRGVYLNYAHEGNAAFLEPLEKVIVEKGGKILKETEISKIIVDKFVVKGVVIETDDGEKEISANAVISNVGPKKTVEITGEVNFDKAYLDEVGKISPTPLVVIANIISDEPFFEHDGLVWPIGNPPLVCLITPTNSCPELAPPGKHILQSYSGIMEPRSEIDVKSEIDLNLETLYELIPDAKVKGRVLSVGCWHKEWPLFHSVWYDIPPKTSVVNLYNVGDGVKIPGLIGVSLCAETARIAVEDIINSFDPGE
ncbi:MAG: NAD(P)/FAD-dependent oxidoreductase [Desulfobacterales bacterium]|nr:NAD(P)/FAD-dependent oxidoreductase [Desulfobacteraceae bacterium]MBT7086697.1 NAD(P)/FAD-dependent oxidoreductase [Desulfobacterales bacterium]MBT7698504.1 NAD(P)/FAD-dependent oxidoreductase [Desulfobacterales bacterium]